MNAELGDAKALSRNKRGYVHRLFKKYKVGLLKENDLSCSDRALLLQYYPFLFDEEREF